MSPINSKPRLPSIEFHSKHCATDFIESLHDYGFAALNDHPLDMQLVRKIYRTWNDFFDSNEKHRFEVDRESQDGYFSIQKAESAKGFSQKDFKEYFHYYPWGRCPQELREDIQTYYQQAQAFSIVLLQWVEQHSPAETKRYFSQSLPSMIHGSASSLLRILRYPAVKKGQHVSRAAPHEDINLLTILPAADGPGLQILDREGHWMLSENQEDQVLINTGDMLQELSRGYYPSTTHKVATPDGDENSAPRMSLPLFLHPKPDVVLSDRYTAKSYLDERLVELGVLNQTTGKS
ncbi:MAG: isopenicillin N synthase family oxygenase [Gammaproteobacteria bacterium]|jgi:isopenicillin N synthase-like dioxygenase|nr:isopenicillin N synthase family oxygenase [Gammaproteobacteria bacterium]MBT5202293.1 isopenicillin N synthase family oxygenase [Gammaproteobacteria bacterium]MBT5601941.1 isopenicillin N synthase family oxygenase [Gammaproteobacteria bacterium]MBT6245790.1 isopenicillin N synthase family oxygenase [Gammaproteobacteria bacterium]